MFFQKKSRENRTVNQHKPAIENAQRSIVGLLVFKWNVVHIHAEGPAFFCWLPKLFEKRVVTIHGEDCFPKDIKQLIVQSEIESA